MPISFAITALLWATSSTCGFVAATFFLKFWRETKDAFFLLFALAFAILGVHWLMLALNISGEHVHYNYLVRLVAFVVIILAIVQKNRR